MREFKCKIEELPFLGAITHEYFIRDKQDFIRFSPVYNDPFAANLLAQNKRVDELVSARKITAEMKRMTQKLAADFTRARNALNKIERYVTMAEVDGLPLKIAAVDFGISEARVNLAKKNDEGVVLNLNVIRKNIQDNMSILEDKGYNADIQNELDTLIKDITSDSLAQTMKKKERQELVRNNIGELNKLWKIIDDILKTGKSIYKGKDDQKVRDYTYTELIRNVQIRRQKEDPKAPASSSSMVA
jgi:hypothetical protein